MNGSGEALGILFSIESIGLILLGTALGTIAAVLPGIAPVTIMALLLVLTTGMDKYDAFVFLVTMMAAGGFAGSMTSILLNVPGDGINAATCLDGYPLARRGKAGLAIGASAAASGLGALIGLGALVLTLPIQRNLVLAIGPDEIFAISILGISLVAVVSGGEPLKGLIAGAAGMVIGFIGVNFTVGGERYTFGILELYGGAPLAALLIGLFALPELALLLRTGSAVSGEGIAVGGGVMGGVLEVLRRPRLLFQSSVIGSLTGMVPGVGGAVASWLAYFTAKRTSASPETFGHGNIEGVIAPEAAIDAKEGGSLVPVFILGLPGSVSTAVLIAAFQFHGVVPGASLFRDEAPLVWVMIFGMVAANLMTSLAGLGFANTLVKLTLVPSILIAPIVFVVGFVGAYAEATNYFGILVALAAGLLGLVFVRFGYPRPPFIIGLLLLPVAESNFHLARQLHRGSYSFLTEPITFAVLALVVLGSLGPWLMRGVRRRLVANRAMRPATETPAAARSVDQRELRLVMPMAGVAILFAILAFTFSPNSRLFPLIVLTPLVAMLGLRSIQLLRSPASPYPVLPQEFGDAAGDFSLTYIVAWVALLALLMWTLGVFISVPIYLVLFFLFFERHRPSRSRVAMAAITSVVMVLGLFYVFQETLGVRFQPGILLDILS